MRIRVFTFPDLGAEVPKVASTALGKLPLSAMAEGKGVFILESLGARTLGQDDLFVVQEIPGVVRVEIIPD